MESQATARNHERLLCIGEKIKALQNYLAQSKKKNHFILAGVNHAIHQPRTHTEISIEENLIIPPGGDGAGKVRELNIGSLYILQERELPRY